MAQLQQLGDCLIQARKDKGWTQQRLALEMGLFAQQIQRYEKTAYQRASLSRCIEIATALGITFVLHCYPTHEPYYSSDPAPQEGEERNW